MKISPSESKFVSTDLYSTKGKHHTHLYVMHYSILLLLCRKKLHCTVDSITIFKYYFEPITKRTVYNTYYIKNADRTFYERNVSTFTPH